MDKNDKMVVYISVEIVWLSELGILWTFAPNKVDGKVKAIPVTGREGP
jgi:hypothetical protein